MCLLKKKQTIAKTIFQSLGRIYQLFNFILAVVTLEEQVLLGFFPQFKVHGFGHITYARHFIYVWIHKLCDGGLIFA